MAAPSRPRRSRRRLAPWSVLLPLALFAVYCKHLMVPPGAGKLSKPSAAVDGVPDTSAAAQVHGRLQKTGALAVVSLLAEGRKWSDLLFPPDWIQRRLTGEKPEPPSKYCNPMINDKYKVIYVKCPKTGGTTVMDGYFSHCDLKRHYDWCLHMADYTNATEVAHLNAVWADYFVFGFSRNVLRRAVSQYTYLAGFVAEGCRMPWADYCQDPYVIGDACSRKDASGAPCCTQVPPEHQYLHVAPQANCLATRDGGYALDWLGRVEHFEEDFQELLTILNSRPGVPKLPDELPGQLNNVDPCLNHTMQGTKRGQQQLKHLDCGKLSFYTGQQNEHCHAAIRSFYKEDFLLLDGQQV